MGISGGQRCLSSLNEKCRNKEKRCSDQFFQPHCNCTIQEGFNCTTLLSRFLLRFWLRRLLDPALFCVPQRAVRTEPEQPHVNSFSTTGKILRPLVTPVVSLEKWRSGKHFAGGWLTCSLGELEMFLLLLSSTAVLLLNTVQRCFSLS